MAKWAGAWVGTVSGFQTGPPLNSLLALGKLLNISAFISSEVKWDSSNQVPLVSPAPDLGHLLGGEPQSQPIAGLSGPEVRQGERPTQLHGPVGAPAAPHFCTWRHFSTGICHPSGPQLGSLGELVLHRMTPDQLKTGFRTEPANECSLPSWATWNALGAAVPPGGLQNTPHDPACGCLSWDLGLAALPPFPPHSSCSRISPQKKTWSFILPLLSKEPWLRRGVAIAPVPLGPGEDR